MGGSVNSENQDQTQVERPSLAALLLRALDEEDLQLLAPSDPFPREEEEGYSGG